jgi:hypothetical protein
MQGEFWNLGSVMCHKLYWAYLSHGWSTALSFMTIHHSPMPPVKKATFDRSFTSSRAVQDYDLYSIHYDHFELLWLQYDSLHILSSLITVEYNIIWWLYLIIIILYSSATKMHNSGTVPACICHICHIRTPFTAGIDGCLVAKHWKNILDTLRQSLANDFPKNIDDIIVHVFSIAFYKRGNHNRYNVLWKILYDGSGLCFDTKQQIILLVLTIYMRYFPCSEVVLCINIKQYHYSFLTKKH